MMNLLRRIYRMLNTESMARTIADQPFDGEDINGWIFRTTVFPSPSTTNTNQLEKEQKKLNGKNKAQKNGFGKVSKKRGAGMSEQIDKSTQEWLKEIGAESPDAELKNRIAELSETARGAGGYGSTGK